MSVTATPDALIARLIAGFATDIPEILGVAVSGGSDSLGLLTLLHLWRTQGGPELQAVTLDHGLRAASADEAAQVAQICAGWDIPHTTLNWSGSDAKGNIPDQARRARYGLMADWAKGESLSQIALGHTRDDQAETVLMRLARSSGVDGLAAMRPSWEQGGVTFLRPVLAFEREELRDVLRQEGLGWVDDPSNEDPTYDRTKARAALVELAPLGITSDSLNDVAHHMARTREALDRLMFAAFQPVTRMELGDVVTDRAAVLRQEPELTRRFLQQAMAWITGADYPPRAAALMRAMEEIGAGKATTLQGCYVYPSKDTLRLTREAGAVTKMTAKPGEIWDGRWTLTGPATSDMHIATLGEKGLPHCPNRAESPLPAASLTATPAIWQGDTLIAAPLAGLENGWTAKILPREERDFAARITH